MDSLVDCGPPYETPGMCNVILETAKNIPVCDISIALKSVFQNETGIVYNGVVTEIASSTTAQSDGEVAKQLLSQTSDISRLNSSQVDQLISQLERILAKPNVSLALGNTSIHIVSNLLGASQNTMASSSKRIIGIVDTVGLKLVVNGGTATILSPSLALLVKTVDGGNFPETSFSILDPGNVQSVSRARRSVRASIPQGSIRLPSSLTQNLSPQQQLLASRVQFNFYQKSTVFQDRSLGDRKLISGVLSASVANLSITGLKENAVITLRNSEPIPTNFVASCVFWDFNLNDGSGGWSTDGCSVLNSTVNETVCGCNHLTSFGILLDISRQNMLSPLQSVILTYITYIGCGISAIFLSVTLLTYLAFGKLRKDIPSKILIQLCIALLFLNMVFLVDAWLALYPDQLGLCISTAWFLHYFLLASFTWMGLESVHMYLALVKVFNTYISRYMLKFSLVGWGVPLIVVIVVIAVDKNNYGLVTYGKFTAGSPDDL
ncbi:adhesion G-protein coupled receptor G2-like [Aplochiton taeniatus]